MSESVDTGRNALFPVFLKLERLNTLVVGGGKVGLEKLTALMANSPKAAVTLVGREISADIRELAASHPQVLLLEKDFEESDLDGHDLVIIATASRDLNLRIREMAAAWNILSNVADTPDLCDFYLSSIVQKGHLKLAVSTNGKSPTIAKRVKEMLHEAIPENINQSLDNLEVIRKRLNGDFAYKVQKLNEITSVLASGGEPAVEIKKEEDYIRSLNQSRETMKDQSKLVRIQADRSANREHSVPLYLTSSFIFENAEQGRALFAEEESGNIYSRYSNPNTTEFIEKVRALEGAEAGLAFSSGMAAVFASIAGLLSAGDHIVSCRSIFGSTHQLFTRLFPRWGITHTYVDASRPEDWEGAIRENTKMIFLETPSNPGLELIDLEWAGQLAAKHKLILNVDNCFATPYLQKPIQYGAHIVSHSATKYMDGQGRVLGGILVGQRDLMDQLMFFIRNTGPAMSPFNAWTVSKSLETLGVRMDRHCSSALEIARLLEAHPEVENVRYPFLPSHPQYELAKKQMKAGGGIVTFVVKGGYDRARRFLDALDMILLTSNLGDTRTIATHPASTTHSKLTAEERRAIAIEDGSIRISVGLEDVEDIITDITRALERSTVSAREVPN